MSTQNERLLATMNRAILLAIATGKQIDQETIAIYLETCKDIIAESDDGVRKPRNSDEFYRYEGTEYRDFAKVEKDYKQGESGSGGDDDRSVCDAKRLGISGKVCMFSVWKKDESGSESCVLDIYFDYTLQYVLQPVVIPETGKLIGFARSDNYELCGQCRLRNNLKTWADKGQKVWECEHKFETDTDYLVASPRYNYDLNDSVQSALWQKLCDKFYKVHPRTKIDSADLGIESVE